jgi:hypothetical protein
MAKNFASNTVQRFGIDADTRTVRLMVERLSCLKNTVLVTRASAYREAPEVTQVHLDTYWSEEQLALWLCKSTGIEFSGIYVRDLKNPSLCAN